MQRSRRQGVHQRDDARHGPLSQDGPDTKRLEVVADGLPLHHCRASLGDPVLLSSRAKLEDGGQKHGIHCDTWPKATRARGEPFPLQRTAEAAWLRWRVIMACSAAKSFALPFLESRTCVSSDHSADLEGQYDCGSNFLTLIRSFRPKKHLRPVLLDHRGLYLFSRSARGWRAVPEAVVNNIRLGGSQHCPKHMAE